MNGWVFLLFCQFFTDLVIVLDIPIARQVIGSLYFIFIPGFMLLRLFDLKELDTVQTYLFSIGISAFFWMSLGVMINEIFPILRVHNPLSVSSLMITMNLITVVLCLIGYLFKKNFKLFLKILNLPPWILLFSFLPVLSIAGTFLVNSGGSNILLVLLIIIVSGLVLWYVLSGRIKFFSDFNSFVLLMIAISLLFHTSLITNYIIGYDVYEEFYVFRLTENSLRWNSSSVSTHFNTNKVNGMLSVTILPTIYSQMLKIEENLIFKLLYPFIFSLLAIALYKLYSKHLDETTAFLSVFFFMANSAFFNLFSSRQMVAELFFVLLFLVLFDKKLDSSKKTICYVAFSAALVVSHYSISYIFMFFIFFVWISQLVNRKFKLIIASQILCFSILAFGWYVFTTKASSFNDLLNTFNFIYRNLNADLFNPSARGTLVLTALGATQADSIGHQVSRVLFHISESLIIIGFIELMRRGKKRRTINEGFLMLVFLNFTILLLSIIIPNFAGSMGISRLYHIVLLTLAPLCIIGGKAILAFITKQKIKSYYASILLITYLISFFMFQTGFVFAVTGEVNWSIPLSIHRGEVENLALYDKIISEQEVLGAQWWHEEAFSNLAVVYADTMSVAHHLTAYGMVPYENMRILSNDTKMLDSGSYVYLRRLNVVYGIVKGQNYEWYTTEFSSILYNSSKIYSNGESEIYLSVLPDGG